MERKFKELQEMQLLRKLELAYDVRELKYNLLKYEFTYLKGDILKKISLEEIIKHVYADVPKDEVQLQLEEIAGSYLPKYINEQIVTYYQENQLDLPRHLYIFKGLIQFVDKDGDVFYVPFTGGIHEIFKKFDKIINK